MEYMSLSFRKRTLGPFTTNSLIGFKKMSPQPFAMMTTTTPLVAHHPHVCPLHRPSMARWKCAHIFHYHHFDSNNHISFTNLASHLHMHIICQNLSLKGKQKRINNIYVTIYEPNPIYIYIMCQKILLILSTYISFVKILV